MSQLTRTPDSHIAEQRPTPVPPPLLVTVKLACQMLGLGRTSIHHLIVSGELKPIRIGTAVRFSVEHLREFINAHAADHESAREYDRGRMHTRTPRNYFVAICEVAHRIYSNEGRGSVGQPSAHPIRSLGVTEFNCAATCCAICLGQECPTTLAPRRAASGRALSRTAPVHLDRSAELMLESRVGYRWHRNDRRDHAGTPALCA